MVKKIMDKNISTSDYLRFRRCRIIENGKRIIFQYANGVSYEVPMDYFLKWFHHPHFILRDGRSVEWTRKSGAKRPVKTPTFVKWRRLLDGSIVRIYLSDNTVYEAAWDTVLMTCERDYEHFGGLTEESEKIVQKWHSKCGRTNS